MLKRQIIAELVVWSDKYAETEVAKWKNRDRLIRYCPHCNQVYYCIPGYRYKHVSCNTRMVSPERLTNKRLMAFLEKARNHNYV